MVCAHFHVAHEGSAVCSRGDRGSLSGVLSTLRRRDLFAFLLQSEVAWDAVRLAELGRCVRSIERGLTMTNSTLELKALPPPRLAQTSAEMNDTTEIGATTEILFATLVERLTAAGLPVKGQSIRTYYARPDATLKCV